jgi:hypothetical protein
MISNVTPASIAQIIDNAGLATVYDLRDCLIIPTTLALFEANAVAGGIEVRWQLAAASEVVASRLERADAASGPWAEVGATVSDQGGVMVALDRTAQPGRSYWYRISTRDPNGEWFASSAISVGMTAQRLEFALGRISPNPSRGGMTRVEFSLAREANVRLAIVDLQGREVARLADGSFGPGQHEARWDGNGMRGSVPPGLYFVTYQVDGKTYNRRLAITR